ncbi:peptidase inhibitor 16-like [Diabrotica virgifera virgifera]|uniref:SCP domain-containing protein n=1 Tax=Diabrotica virgifera virgifera TaxID=50390 RepID=A0ABM5L2N1_DIAVI|nr:peptidase inhibitor 16-like [Diabrotica virgifera virgifera]
MIDIWPIFQFRRLGRKIITHATQFLWAKTTHIGCALSKSVPTKEAELVKYYIVCNYGPMGNMIGETVYERGEPCSKCPYGVACNVEFPALCGEVDDSQINPQVSGGENILSIGVKGVSDAATVNLGGYSKTGVTGSSDAEADSASKHTATNAVTKDSSNVAVLTVANVNTRMTVVAVQDARKNPTQITVNSTVGPNVLGIKQNCNTCASNINVASLTCIFIIYLALLCLIE